MEFFGLAVVPAAGGFRCMLEPVDGALALTVDLVVGTQSVTIHPDAPDVFIAQWPVDEGCTALLWQQRGSYAYGGKVLPTMEGGWTTQAPGLTDSHPVPESLRADIPPLRFWNPPPRTPPSIPARGLKT